MKAIQHLALLACTLLAAGTVVAQSLQLNFADIDRYRDFSLQGITAERTRPVFEGELRRALEPDLPRVFKEGEVLVITFTDIDMAGEIQPWRNRNNSDIRYIENIYPPRLSFDYKVQDSEGNVSQEGSARITDLAFTLNAMPVRSGESFHHETQLLRDWVRRYFREQ